MGVVFSLQLFVDESYLLGRVSSQISMLTDVHRYGMKMISYIEQCAT